MRIERIETLVVKYPWGPPEDGVTRTWPIHRIYADNGLVGIGRGGNPDLITREFGSLLVGEDPRRIGRLWQRMYDVVWRFCGPERADMPSIGALDVALWDLYGKLCGQPVWRLLGGFRGRIPAFADGIGAEERSPDETAAKVKEHASLGFDAVKFHFSRGDPQEVVDKVRICRQALGPDR